MDFILFVLSFSVFIIALALFANRARAAQDPHFELKTNCLLTRYPLLFVTGHRSLFYFSKYWNIYTPYLAEHGYEVFTLHLPWANPKQRLQRLQQFVAQQTADKTQFHLVMDTNTLTEFETYFKDSAPEIFLSVTEIKDPRPQDHAPVVSLQKLKAYPFPVHTIECVEAQPSTFFFDLSYRMHLFTLKAAQRPSLSCLGGCAKTQFQNAALLLEQAQQLAESDMNRP